MPRITTSQWLAFVAVLWALAMVWSQAGLLGALALAAGADLALTLVQRRMARMRSPLVIRRDDGRPD